MRQESVREMCWRWAERLFLRVVLMYGDLSVDIEVVILLGRHE